MSAISTAHVRRAESAGIAYRVAVGDELLQDTLFAPATIRRGLDMLAAHARGGRATGGDLAYTPEMVHRFEEVLQRRYDASDGPEVFEMPNYAPFVDTGMAAFYGCHTTETSMVRTRMENYEEATERLLRETAREVESEMAGLAQMMDHYRAEEWARYGIAEEAPFSHADPDNTLLRNPGGGWCTMDRPAATSDKGTVIDMYDAVPDHTYATPHEGWLVDRRGAFWDELPAGGPPATGFY
jgi:hypothetical protein